MAQNAPCSEVPLPSPQQLGTVVNTYITFTRAGIISPLLWFVQAAAYEVRIRQLEQHMARSVSGRSGPYFSGAASGTTSRDIGSASGFVSGALRLQRPCLMIA